MKILIIRFSSIGDIVLTSPVVRIVKQQCPQAEVHFVTKQQYASFVEASPYIDRTWALTGTLRQLAKQLRTEKYDYILDLHGSLRSRLLRLLLWRKTRQFNKLNWRKWLLVKWHKNTLPPVHIVDRYLDTAKPLGVHNDMQGLDFFIPSGTSLPPDVQLPANYIALALGAQHATKRMPLDKVVYCASMLAHPVVLLGGMSEVHDGQTVKAKVPSVIDLCGRLNLFQSALVLQNAQLVIAHDTGLMHIAAALKKPIYSVWGSTVPEFGMYPYLPGKGSLVFEVQGLHCRPCSKIGFTQCPQGHFNCMNHIDYHSLVQQANQAVERTCTTNPTLSHL